MILLPMSVSRKQNHADCVSRKLSCTAVSAGSKRSHTAPEKTRYDRHSEQEVKTGPLVNTLCYLSSCLYLSYKCSSLDVIAETRQLLQLSCFCNDM